MKPAETTMPIQNTSPGSERNIVLTGFMGTGKSSVARELAHMLGREVIDLDTEIEKNAGMSITSIFATFGEPRFRELETDAARQAAQKRGAIISTGGGVVLRRENVEALKASGIIFCLAASPETILKRTSANRERPLLQVPDPLAKITEMLNARGPCYMESCDYMIDTGGKTPKEVAQEIQGKLKIG
ncbi:MAG: shikimate kinase [Nitrospiraceae bacterium]|nr:shikimate kinase [Nitrospiraceae bacterium]